ncbi:MAG: ABC transporter ATP-binding protein [Archaeoglobaceae archaeon]
MKNSNSIVLQEVKKSFGSFKALNGINLEIADNTSLALLGPNGAGKTTLLKLISGITKPTDGQISVFDHQPWKFSKDLRKKMGMVSHNPFLYGELTANENLTFYGKVYEVEDLKNRIDEVLSKMGLKRRKHTLVKSFSRGMKQRLSIARALLNNPELLILDEPTSGLDIVGRKELLKYLEDYKTNRTVLLATHDLEEARICDMVAVIINGEIMHFSKMSDQIEDIYMDLAQPKVME